MRMRDVDLETATLNGGEAVRNIDRAIEAAIENIEAHPNLLGDRTISVSIKIKPNGESKISTEAKVETKFPVKSSTGVGWITGGVARTMENIVDHTGQLDWTMSDRERREAASIASADRTERDARERHAMGLRRAEAEDRAEEARAPKGFEGAVGNLHRQLGEASRSGFGVSLQFGGQKHDLNEAARQQTAQANAARVADDDGAEPDTFDPSEEDGGVLGATIAATEGRRKPKPQGAPRRKGE